MSRLKTSLPETLATTVKSTIADWQSGGKMQRLWQRDATLWTGSDEANWLGWLDIVEEQTAQHEQLAKVAKEVQTRGFEHILLLGMGGSSLCPEVLRMTFGRVTHFPTLHVLDSTDPAQVKAFEHLIDIPKTLFIVSSKSGSTLEPNIFKQYFFERTKQAVGAAKAGSQFIAITDPGSKMQQVAEADRFLHVFFGRPSIGGRYSALSNFGMVPAAVMGMDTKKFLARAAEMVRACGPSATVEENPGAVLGIILGNRRERRTRQGHDHHFPWHFRFGSVARTTAGGVDRQDRQGHHPSGPRNSDDSRGLQQRSRLRLCSVGNRH